MKELNTLFLLATSCIRFRYSNSFSGSGSFNASFLIIGAGIAGLATSVRLRSSGYNVIVFEMNSYPGGKLTEFTESGYRFDMGPSLFTMPQFVEELFDVAGKKLSDYFEYKRKNTVCHYFYEDGTRFQAASDPD